MRLTFFGQIEVLICLYAILIQWLEERERVSRRDIDQLKEGMEKRAFFYWCRRETLSKWMAGSNPILFASGCLGISNVRAVVEEAKKRRLSYPFLKDSDFRPAIVLPQLF